MNRVYHLYSLLAIGVFFSFFSTLGFVPLFDLDEGAFSEATREMLQSGNYLTTYLDGNLRFDKPILIYWFQALSVKIFGLNEFALRFPSALSASFWVLATFLFVKRFFNIQSAFLASFFMICSLQITIIAKAAIADALLNLFIALSMFSIYKLYQTKKSKFIYLTYIFVALGTLTKGPVAILIPLVVSFIFFAFKMEIKFWFKSVFNPKALGVFFLIATPWYILEYIDQGQKFIDGFFLKHNLERFDEAMEGHYGSFLYYIPVLLIGLLPFSYLILRVFVKFKDIIKNDLFLFLFIWFLFVFIFFSFSGTKLPHYIIYGYTPLFILGAIFYDLKVKSFWTVFPSVMLYMILLILPLIFFIGGVDMIQDEFAKEILKESLVLFDFKYFAILIVASLLSFILIKSNWTNYTKLLITGLMFIGVINFLILPLVANAKQMPIKEAALLAKKNNYQVKMYRINTPSFVFYMQQLSKKGKLESGDIVFTKVNRLKNIKKYDIIYQKRGVALIKVKEID